MKPAFIQQKFFRSFIIIVLIGSLSGCAYLVVGSIGALGGYVISPDTVEGVTGNDAESVWDATVDIVSVMGTIEEEYKNTGLLMARVNRAKVTIAVIALNSSTTKLTVKARKFKLPKITVAQDVFVKIMSSLNE